MTNPAPEPENPALDDLDGDEVHQFIGEPVSPEDDPNIKEHYDE